MEAISSIQADVTRYIDMARLHLMKGVPVPCEVATQLGSRGIDVNDIETYDNNMELLSNA